MKNLKTYEYYTTSSTSPINVNFNNGPELSDIVKYTIDYINDNYNNIDEYQTNIFNEIIFENKKTEIYLIRINKDTLPYLEIIIYEEKYNNISEEYHITNEEYNYLKEFFTEIIIKLKKDKEKKFKAKDIIDPVKRNAKKYNL